MKSAWIPWAVGLLGVGLGWFLGDVLRDPVAIAPVPETQARRAAPAPPPEPTLVGLPPPSTAASGAPAPAPPRTGPAPADREVLEVLGDGDLEAFSDLETRLEPTDGDPRGWSALLTLYALAGRLADFQRILPRALEAGMAPRTVLELVSLLPPEKQVAALDHVLGAFPDLVFDVGTIADLYTGAGAGERAVDVLVPALEAGADADLACRLVRADPDRAARILGALSSGEDWTAEMLAQVGTALVGEQRPDLAMTFLQDALAREPANLGVLMALAEIDRPLALRHAYGLTEEYPDRADVWTWLGQLEAAAGHGEAAFDAYREAAARGLTTEVLYGMLSADPERAYEAAAELSAEVTDDEVLGAIAKVAMKTGRIEDTMATLLRAHERDPSDHEWMKALVTLDPERAAEILGQTARSYAGESRDEVVGAYGNALLGTGHPDEAFERYREAYELDPSDWEWQRGLARADPERAIPLLEARREETGDEGDLLGALADAYAGAGRRQQALETYQRALDAGGGDEWYARMGLLDRERALTGLQRRADESPDASEVWGALGDLYRELGEADAARAAYDRARATNDTSLLYEIRYRQAGD